MPERIMKEEKRLKFFPDAKRIKEADKQHWILDYDRLRKIPKMLQSFTLLHFQLPSHHFELTFSGAISGSLSRQHSIQFY